MANKMVWSECLGPVKHIQLFQKEFYNDFLY